LEEENSRLKSVVAGQAGQIQIRKERFSFSAIGY
jgi:hypothetical protein